MATTTTQNCWLLAIPPELRLDVYELVFSQSAVGIAAFESDHEPWKFNTSRSYEGSYRGSLLSTCKTTFKEALPVSYKNTAFHILIYDGQFSYVPHFCIPMCLPRPELITQLTLRFHCTLDETFENLLNTFKATLSRLDNCRNVSLLQVLIWDEAEKSMVGEQIDELRSVLAKIECPGTFKLVLEESKKTCTPTTSKYRHLAEAINS
jgi:hypothetical protein